MIKRPFIRLFFAGYVWAQAPLLMADELTWYIYPSANSVDYSSPSSLARSVVANIERNDQFFLGDVHFHLRCGTFAEEPKFEFKSGIAMPDRTQTAAAISDQKYGFGVSFLVFDSDWIESDSVERVFEKRATDGTARFVSFIISRSTCMRLMRYIESYSSLNYHTKTGVTNRPLFREGGNSTAFAVSLLEVAGLLFPEFEIKWRRDLFFPMRLVGGHPTGLRVELESLFTSPDAKRWSEYSHEHIPAVIWDPEKIDRWVTSIYQGSIFHPNLPVFTAQHRSAFGIIIDASLVSTPQGVFWNN